MARERSASTIAYTPKKSSKKEAAQPVSSGEISSDEEGYMTPETPASASKDGKKQSESTPTTTKSKKITFDDDGMSSVPIIEKKKAVEVVEDDSDDAPEEETMEDGQEKTLSKEKEVERLAALEKEKEKEKRRQANDVLAKQAKAKKAREAKLAKLRQEAAANEEEEDEEEEDEEDLPLEVLEAFERTKNMPVEEAKKPKKRVFTEVEEEIKKGPVSVRVLKRNKSKLPPKAEGATTVGRAAFLNRPSVDRRKVRR